MFIDKIDKTFVAIGVAAVVLIIHFSTNDAAYEKGFSEASATVSQQYEETILEKTDASYHEGYSQGYEEGYQAGFDMVYDEETFNQFFSEQISKAETAARSEAEKEWSQKLAAANSDWQQKYNSAYSSGYNAGVAAAQKPTVSYSTQKPAASTTQSVTVYVTRTGSKYHRFGCSYLNESRIAISLSSARSQGYTACSRCY